jgi:hypothetical protein
MKTAGVHAPAVCQFGKQKIKSPREGALRIKID